MLLVTLGICWALVGSFMYFQYRREREFKASLLDTVLQTHNDRIVDDLARGIPPDSAVSLAGETAAGPVRVTLVGPDGAVVYDSNGGLPASDHNSRPEVAAARAVGRGHALERVSESDDMSYFYSAALGADGVVVRSAVPYTNAITEFLRADSSVIWIMGALTLMMSLLAFLITRKISISIGRLNAFAGKAERGERIYDDEAFPSDELGSIAGHIVRLYVQRDEQHREALRQQEDKARLKKQLTNNINHELKTPVASIMVNLDLLSDHPELTDESRTRIMDRIRANAERLSALLRDVSTITRMDDGAAMIERRPLDLQAIIMEVADESRLRTDMKIMVDVPPMKIMGERSLLESIFRNLIDNAIEYSGATELHIKADSAGRFRVWDNGCGIAPEHLPHIFERFYRVDDGRTRTSGGTGLGLSIVRNAVAIHGGSIRASSLRGLAFVFTLKLIKT